MTNPAFRSAFAETIFTNKFRHEGCETYDDLCETLVEDVCRDRMSNTNKQQLIRFMQQMKIIAGGRYLYYAGRELKLFNNCFLFKSEEDSREDWAMLSWKVESALASGGGIGNDYSVYRPAGSPLKRTGGVASGPLSKAKMINEMGREIMQGGSRRSALYASIDATHDDAARWLRAKNWHDVMIPGTQVSYADAKNADFNFPCPLDMTNISLNYKTRFIEDKTAWRDPIFLANVGQAMRTGEPGFSFNFWDKEDETGRNACTEVTTADDSDVCNLASINLSRIEDIDELADVVRLGTEFLILGTLVADLPFEKVREVREKNRRLGLGLMGVHEWLIARGKPYGPDLELGNWLQVWQSASDRTSAMIAYNQSISQPVANRAVAPTGTIGILAGTTTGIEPLYAVAYKRRYLVGGTTWKYQYVVDSAAAEMISRYGADPESIESAVDLAQDVERRVKMQAFVQDFTDQGISSTINMPPWGSEHNNEGLVSDTARLIYEYAPRLRGLTFYPDGSRG